MTRLSSHFRSKADDARVARMWCAVDERLERRARQRPVRLLLALAACATAAALGFWELAPSAARRDAPQMIELSDGSRVEHGTRDQIEIAAVTPERVELRMTRGRARFRVARNPKRVFLTRAGAFTIRVVGTEYAVELGVAGVRVQVSRGEVEVRRDGSSDLWRVSAGEEWSSAQVATSSRVKPAAELTPKPAAFEAQTTAEQPRDPRAKAGRPVKASAARSPAVELFQRAQEARIAGHKEETERLLSEFVARFPEDPRTGLAAFELGRLRLEAGDAQGAIEALDHANSAGAALAEQIEARRVQALEQHGNLARCRAAREAFLARFPGGTFAEVVRRRCP